jgi:hypothetical protein
MVFHRDGAGDGSWPVVTDKNMELIIPEKLLKIFPV